jgi:glucosyl-3-phosphoglycerate synthase
VNPYKVLVPIDESSGPELLSLAARLIGVRPGLIIALAVVELPPGTNAAAGAVAARAARRTLRRLTAQAHLGRIEIQTRVRAAHRTLAGICEVADEERPDLLLLAPGPDETLSETAEALLLAPPCDTVVARLEAVPEPASILVPARGGPAAELALSLALELAAPSGARVTLLHLDVPGTPLADRQHELRLFESLLASSSYPRLRSMTVPAAAAEAGPALVQEAARHQVTILGASASPEQPAGQPLGRLPHLMLARAPGAVLVAKPRRSPAAGLFTPLPAVGDLVDKWFVENTFHCREFSDIEDLAAAKRAQQRRASVIIAPPSDADALPAILRVVHDDLGRRAGLVDDVIVVDDGAHPDIAGIATAGGAAVVQAPAAERGRALWSAIEACTGDIILILGGDLRNPHPRFVYGLAGPLLREPRIGLVAGFHGLPRTATEDDFADENEHITELAIRPLLSLFFPELSGLINPLAAARAVRREALAGIRLPSGLGVDLAMVLQVYERDGLATIAQCDLEEYAGRREGARELARRAFAAVQALAGRITSARMTPARLPQTSMKVIHREAERYHIEVVDMAESLLPPVRLRPVAAELAPSEQ